MRRASIVNFIREKTKNSELENKTRAQNDRRLSAIFEILIFEGKKKAKNKLFRGGGDRDGDVRYHPDMASLLGEKKKNKTKTLGEGKRWPNNNKLLYFLCFQLLIHSSLSF